MSITGLGYLGVESPRLSDWKVFGPDILGLQLLDDSDDDVVRLKADERHHRVAIHPGTTDRLAYLGWEVAGPSALRSATKRLVSRGVEVAPMDPDTTAARHVVDGVTFHDHLQLRHELFYGQLSVPGSFTPGRGMSGFVTDGQGLGHVVLVVPELEEASTFYQDALGFCLSDTVSGMFRLEFFHVNTRHHTLAIMEIPGMKGLQHLMLQVHTLDDVGVAYDLCQTASHDITLTLGRHTNDRMISFYVKSPSSFDVEYGYGAVEVAPGSWVVGHYDRPSYWGHRFQGTGMPGALEPA